MKKVFRISTVPSSLNILLKGQLKYLSHNFEVTAISGAGHDLDETRRREDVKTHAIEMQRPIALFKDLVSLVKLYWYFKKERPDIIHSITPKAGLLSMIAGKLAGVPVRIHTFTGLLFPYKSGLMKKILITMDRLLCYCATNIYPEGQGVRKDLVQYKITKKALKVIANGNVNGIDMDYFDPELFSTREKQILRKEFDIKDTDFIFLFIGRLVRDKGINELTDAFIELNARSPEAKLLLVGPFEQELDPILPETKQKIENNTNIIFVGFQKDVRPYFAIADTFVFPSYREGFPNVLLQAGAMGLFSIVTDISGNNEIITNALNGQIVSVKDKNELFSAMSARLTKKNDDSHNKNICRSLIAKGYDQSDVWEAIKNEYKNLLSKY